MNMNKQTVTPEVERFVFESGKVIGYLGTCVEEALAYIEGRPSPRGVSKEDLIASLRNGANMFKDLRMTIDEQNSRKKHGL